MTLAARGMSRSPMVIYALVRNYLGQIQIPLRVSAVLLGKAKPAAVILCERSTQTPQHSWRGSGSKLTSASIVTWRTSIQGGKRRYCTLQPTPDSCNLGWSVSNVIYFTNVSALFRLGRRPDTIVPFVSL